MVLLMAMAVAAGLQAEVPPEVLWLAQIRRNVERFAARLPAGMKMVWRTVALTEK